MARSVSGISGIALALGLAVLPSVALAETYDVTVTTGHAPYSGTHANVWITAYAVLPASQQPVDSGNIQLTDHGRNDFNQGSTRRFRITTPSNIKLNNIYGLKVDEDNTGTEPDWYLKSIELK